MESSQKPKIVESLLGEEIVDVAVEDKHILAFTKGEVYFQKKLVKILSYFFVNYFEF